MRNAIYKVKKKMMSNNGDIGLGTVVGIFLVLIIGTALFFFAGKVKTLIGNAGDELTKDGGNFDLSNL